jgi:hypothetical protein
VKGLIAGHSGRALDHPSSVGKQNTLLDGEDSRARSWGTALGTAASNAYASAHA